MGGLDVAAWPPNEISLSGEDRVLFLTKDFELIRQQVHEGLSLKMEDLDPDDLLDDINTDVMTPAWVCFDWDPARIAENAYAGLTIEGKSVIGEGGLKAGGFKGIVSGFRKGTGSSRETAPQCERWSGIRLIFARSFAPIHERNNINLGQLMGDLDQLRRLQSGVSLSLTEFTSRYNSASAAILESGGLIPFTARLRQGEVVIPPIERDDGPMTMFEHMIARKRVGGSGQILPGDSLVARVDSGYSHEFTSAQVHAFLKQAHGDEYSVQNSNKFAVFEDHLLYAAFNPRFSPLEEKIQELRDLQSEFQAHTGVRDYSAVNGV
ncbi:MAG TPA: aconitate hydratase, partial [Candidatus Poseidoniales archaeon]|nr:aconitate hydratase [Candidatus Poseidoniales archaeon]